MPFLTFLAVLPMRLYAALAVGVGVLIIFLGVVGGGASGLGVAGVLDNVLILIFLIGIVSILFGLFLVFLASRVGRHARWAYLVAFLLFLGDSLSRLLGGIKPTFTSDVVSAVWWINAWVSFGTAMCAGALLLTSFVRQSD